MSARTRFFAAAVAASAIAVACSSSDDPPPGDVTGSCGQIASRCHSYDKESAIGHECHELGHAGDDSACGPKRDECLAACPPREAGAHDGDASTTPPDGSAGDASQSDAGDACPAYCQCLNDTCAGETGYPFATPADCASACAQQSADERACWPKFCEQAKTATSTKTHLCEHAWGALGLDECDTL